MPQTAREAFLAQVQKSAQAYLDQPDAGEAFDQHMAGPASEDSLAGRMEDFVGYLISSTDIYENRRPETLKDLHAREGREITWPLFVRGERPLEDIYREWTTEQLRAQLPHSEESARIFDGPSGQVARDEVEAIEFELRRRGEQP